MGGGRRVGSAEGFAVLEELAAKLGQTGTRIAAWLYIACGISGPTRHGRKFARDS